jgi:hypothetical protein
MRGYKVRARKLAGLEGDAVGYAEEEEAKHISFSFTLFPKLLVETQQNVWFCHNIFLILNQVSVFSELKRNKKCINPKKIEDLTLIVAIFQQIYSTFLLFFPTYFLKPTL